MKVTDLNTGNAFIYYPTPDLPVVAVKGKSLKTNNIIPIIPVERYFYINQESKASVISKIEEYRSGIDGRGRQEPARNNYQYKKIEDIPEGTVIELETELSKGIPIVVTNNITVQGQIVFSLGNTSVLQGNIIIVDCGYSGTYNGLMENHIKICPNCGRASLINLDMSYQRSDLRCNFCGITLSIKI